MIVSIGVCTRKVRTTIKTANAAGHSQAQNLVKGTRLGRHKQEALCHLAMMGNQLCYQLLVPSQAADGYLAVFRDVH